MILRFNILARKALASFRAHLAKHREAKEAAKLARRVEKASPEIVELRRQIAERSRQHRPIEPLRRRLRETTHARLRAELGVKQS